MTEGKVKLTIRELESYRLYQFLQKEAKEEAKKKRRKIEDLKSIKGISYGGDPKVNPESIDHKINRLLAEEAEALKEDAKLQAKIDAIEVFVKRNFTGYVKYAVINHYFHGIELTRIADDLGYHRTWLGKAIQRSLLKMKEGIGGEIC